MKKLQLGAFAFLSAALMVGCSSQTEKGEIEVVTEIQSPVQIEFWHSMSGALGESLTELVDKFNDTIGKEKGITVESVFQGGYTDAKSKVMAAIKSGESPAIVQGTSNDIQDYLLSGTVQPLNDYIFNEEVGIWDFDDIYNVYKEESLQYDGETYYSMPFSKSTDLLYYNKTFFDEHGLEIPTTWEEVVEVSKQITEITGRPSFGIDNTANFLITGLKQLGGEYTNKDGEILFNNQESLHILELLNENIKNGNWRLAGEDGYMSGPFMSGLSQMYVGSTAGSSFLSGIDFEWSSALVPQFSEDNKAAITQGSSLAILNGNKTAEEVYAAYEFVKYLCSYESNLYWATNTGYLPIRHTVANSEEFKTYVEESNDTTKLYGSQQTAYGFVEASFVGDNSTSNIVRTEVGAMVDEVVLTNLEPQKALDIYESKLK